MSEQLDEFSDEYRGTVYEGDILKLGALEFALLKDPIQNGIKLRTYATADIKSRGALKRRVAEFVHVQSISANPVRLMSLNRRFGRIAKQYETTTMELMQELVDSGRITQLEYGGINAMYSDAIYKENVARRIEAGGEHLGALLSDLMANAQ